MVKLRYLITGFLGANNSSKIIVENIKPNNQIDKLYLQNNFEICLQQLEDKFKDQKFDRIISFGQKPVTRAFCIETVAYNKETKIETSYNYLPLIKYLKDHNLSVRQSVRPGNYLCNYIYYHGLRLIREKNLQTDMLFIHAPYSRNLTNVKEVIDTFSAYILADMA